MLEKYFTGDDIDFEIIDASKKYLISKFGNDTLQEIDVSLLDIDTARHLATVNEISFSMWESLDTYFSKRLTPLLPFYDIVSENIFGFKKHLFTAMCYYYNKDQDVIIYLKRAVWMQHLLGTSVNCNTIKEIDAAIHSEMSPYFGFERDNRFYLTSREATQMSKHRHMEVLTQNKFIDFILTGNYEEAFGLIKSEAKKLTSKN